jgi:hypothetical protein
MEGTLLLSFVFALLLHWGRQQEAVAAGLRRGLSFFLAGVLSGRFFFDRFFTTVLSRSCASPTYNIITINVVGILAEAARPFVKGRLISGSRESAPLVPGGGCQPTTKLSAT